MIEIIKKIAKDIYQELVDIRRDLHSHPEVGMHEFRTQELIINELEKLNCYQITKSFGTGVVALIKGKKDISNNKCIGLRADIDALGIEDLKEVSYKSQNKGACHACGHDMHTTTLLGVAKVLAKIQDDFSGYVKLFFQPAEETDGGAEPMIKEGHLENPHVDAMLGIHVTDSYNVGEVRFCYDTMQAYSDEITIVVNGYSAHAAHPENGVDGILIASQIINNIQSISSRNVSPTDSIALSFGKINGGTIANALAQKVVIDGTLRTLTKSTRDMAIKNLKRLCQNIAEGYGGSAEVIITPCYPALINNKEMVDYVKEKAYQVFDSDKIFVNNVPSLGVEDFAYFAQAVPSCFYNIGIKNEEKGIVYPLHNNKFDADEEALYYAVVLQTLSTISLLQD